MVQAAVLDGLLFDASPFSQDGFAAAEVDVGRCEVADALVVATMIVVFDEGGDGSLEVGVATLERDARQPRWRLAHPAADHLELISRVDHFSVDVVDSIAAERQIDLSPVIDQQLTFHLAPFVFEGQS